MGNYISLLMKNAVTVFKEMLGFIIISLLIGASAQIVLPNGIGLKTEVIQIESDSSSVSMLSVALDPYGNGDAAANILLDDAYAAYQNGTALFLDARSQTDYTAGHIRGAINLPIQAFLDSLPLLEQLDQNLPLITYCDGAECNASIELAANLKMMGFSDVSFFFGGWHEWLGASYPLGSGLK